MKVYSLQSSPLIHAPGMVRNAKVMWKTGDERMAIEVMSAWEIPVIVALDILKGDRTYSVEGDKVIVEVEEPGDDPSQAVVEEDQGRDGGAGQEAPGASRVVCGPPAGA